MTVYLRQIIYYIYLHLFTFITFAIIYYILLHVNYKLYYQN